MPKQKTSKTLSKRFKVTKTGKIMRNRQNAGHLRIKKNKRRIRRFNEPIILNNKQARIIKSLINS